MRRLSTTTFRQGARLIGTRGIGLILTSLVLSLGCSDATGTSDSVSIVVSAETIQRQTLLTPGLPLVISNRGATAVHIGGQPIVEREIRAGEWQPVANVLVNRVIDGPLQTFLEANSGSGASDGSSRAFSLMLDLSAGRYRLSQTYRRLDAFMGSPIDASDQRAYSNAFVVVD